MPETEKKDLISEKEKRIRAITKLYYSNPQVQKAILEFCRNRETVPRYFEGFGKRPDSLNYPSDILGLVNKGATSFHASEEIWHDPLSLKTDMAPDEIKSLRKSWDLLIDIDSQFIDFSKIAAKLLIKELEMHGIKNYGIKFSGSKGFHIIVSGDAFPEEYSGMVMKESFPEWPRAICEYLMEKIKPKFSQEAHSISDISSLKLRTNKTERELLKVVCPNCKEPAKQDVWLTYRCDDCSYELRQRKSILSKKRAIRCDRCSKLMSLKTEQEFFECSACKLTNIFKAGNYGSKNYKISSSHSEEVVEMNMGLHDEETGGFDLVLVAPRHLFRAPYSLHEKTSLASIVILKEEIDSFSPTDANPLKVRIKDFIIRPEKDEAKNLLIQALSWKKETDLDSDFAFARKYSNHNKIDIQGASESDFPKPIKKLLLGLQDGKKRGLFILITFLRSLNFSPEYIAKRVYDWNKLNNPQLKEGYIKSQLEWHFRQKRNIFPPNYSNPSFYKDLNLLDEQTKEKNPISEILKKLRRANKS